MAHPETSLVDRFVQAVRSGNAPALRQLRPSRSQLAAVVNAPIFSFDSPAIAAVAGNDDVELIDALLDLGADPNARSSWWAGGFHPLYSASGAVAERLISAGSIPDACAAAHLDQPDLLQGLLKAEPSRVHERGGDGQTPLHFARSTVVVDLLLEAGADVDARDIDHRATAAEWMLGDADDPLRSRIELARYLVSRGASADIFLAAALGNTAHAKHLLQSDPALLTLRTGQGAYGEKPPSSFHIYMWTIGGNMTPLQTALKFRQHETLEAMKEFASAGQRLLLACSAGDRAEALAIVAKHPEIVASLEADDRRALTDAASAANAPAVRLMLELGFDPSVPSVTGATGGTALHCAAWEGSVECVRALLAYPAGRALVHVKDPTYGGTPLDWCHHGAEHCGNPLRDHSEVERLLTSVQ